MIVTERRWLKWFSSRGLTDSLTLTNDDNGTIVSLRPRTNRRSMSSGVVRPRAVVCTSTSYCSASRL